MLDNYILKRPWQSKSGIQEELYLGYNSQNRLDCVSDLKKAKRMSREECEEFQAILFNSKMWVIDIISEENTSKEVIEETIKENTDETNSN